jgi:hypothetical protein
MCTSVVWRAMCLYNRYLTAAVSALLIGTLLSLGAIIVRSVEATESVSVEVTPADLRGPVR